MRESALVLSVLCWHVSGALAITLGQVDDFQDGSLGGWEAEYNVRLSDYGPNGLGDWSLWVGSDGVRELGAANSGARWQGDYLQAGVNAIEADLRTPTYGVLLEIRLVFASQVGAFTSTAAFLLPPDGLWHHAIFRMTLDDVTPATPDSDLSATLGSVGWVFIRHQSGEPFEGAPYGTPIYGAFQIDNIRAVPEPAVAALVAAAVPWFIRRRSRYVLLPSELENAAV